MRMLALLTRDRSVLRVGELCRDLDLPKSSVSRLLRTMSEFGLIERQARDLGYVAGPRALGLADLYLERHTLLDLIDDSLDALVTEFGFVGYAAILVEPDIMVLRLKHGAYPLRLVQEVGKRIPAYRTAIGRALLARMPEDVALAVVLGGPDRVSEREVRTILGDARTRGICEITGAVIPGIAAIGAAVAHPDRSEQLGFAISYPMTAADDSLQVRMATRVRAEAQIIGARLGDTYWMEQSARFGGGPAQEGSRAKRKEPRRAVGH
jgi:DNA-binding IclR family transcriptional regulator